MDIFGLALPRSAYGRNQTVALLNHNHFDHGLSFGNYKPQPLSWNLPHLARKSNFIRMLSPTISLYLPHSTTNQYSHFSYVYTCMYLLPPKSLLDFFLRKLTNNDSQSSFTDLVIIEPQDFSKSTVDALEDQINTKYANKVVYNVGLCICLWDILKVSEGMVGHGSGAAHVNGKKKDCSACSTGQVGTDGKQSSSG